jgi:peptide/nickel transport system substrate-binding protein
MMNSKYSILFIFMLMAASLFAAPSSQPTSQTSNVMRFGLMTEPATLDALSNSNTADSRSVLFNVYEGLVKSDTSGRLIPAVAESFEMSSDAQRYTFTLRQGIRFHDGSLVQIEDVTFSIDEAKRLNFIGLAQIETVTVSGDRRIIISLRAPDPDFLPYLTFGIVPRNNADRERNPIGTGPFMIERHLPQQQLSLVKNPHYWQSGVPRLDRVTVLFVADSSALFTGLEGGNLDGAMITADLIEKLDERKYNILPGYSNSVQLLALNNNVKPFDDIRVRHAINYAVDVREIIDTAFYGRGEPSGSPLIPGLQLYYNEALRNTYPADLTRARALMAEAGYANGFNLEIKVPSNYTMHVDTAQVIVNQLARINIRATIRLVDWATWLTDVYRGRNYQATIVSFDGNTLSPQSFLSRYVSTASGNLFNFNNTNYDSLYASILRETSEANRIRLYKDAQKMISDEAPAVFIQDIFAFKVFSGGFRGAVNYPLYVIDFSTIYRD